MFSLNNARLESLSVHQVGNKSMDEGVRYSDGLVNINDENLVNVVLRYFLSSFSGNEMYRFFNDVGVEQNEMYTLAKRIFDNPDDLFEQSKTIAQHLYNSSTHSKVKGGELYVGYFRELIVDNKVTEGVGVFKSETKNDFIKVDFGGGSEMIRYHEGTNVNKLDKGCLIFNIKEEEGYKVCIIDNLNKGNDAVYWKDDFLQISALNNDFHQTNQFLGIAKQYVTKHITEDFQVSKADQIDILNRSVDYFKSRESFDKTEFEETVFGDTNVIESFQKFDRSYREENNVELSDAFEISETAVKKQARAFKSVLKLDKNFHIYIHGDRDLIQQGVEQDGRKFYKIYFEDEKW